MTVKFKQDDAGTCFRCYSNPPSFRLISLEKFPTDAGQLESDSLVGLLCDACLRLEIESIFDCFAQSKLPLEAHESTTRCLCRQVGFAVMPISFSERESQLLIDELNPDCLEAP